MAFFTCPLCSHEKELPPSFFGREYRCPKCGGKTMVTEENTFDFAREVAAIVPPKPSPAAPILIVPRGVAALISLLIPGGGQMAKGSVVAGLLWMFGVIAAWAIGLHSGINIVGLAAHILCVLDAGEVLPQRLH